MRISDWSSDVCSSDLVGVLVADPLDRAVLAGRGRRLPHRTQTIEEEILHDRARLGLAEGPVDGLLALDLLVGLGERVVVAAQRRAELGPEHVALALAPAGHFRVACQHALPPGGSGLCASCNAADAGGGPPH